MYKKINVCPGPTNWFIIFYIAIRLYRSSDPKFGVSDEEIIKIAQSISNDGKIQHLGIKLGIQWADVDRFLQTNRKDRNVTSQGTRDMLKHWREMTFKANQRGMLKKALMDAQLRSVADEFFSGG